MNSMRGILLTGKAIPAIHNNKPIRNGITFLHNIWIPSMRILNGKIGPVANNNNCEVNG
jgi:hypothetical protein